MNNTVKEFNPFDFTRSIVELLSNSEVIQAKNLVGKVLEERKLEPENYRIKNALNLIKSIEIHHKEIKEKKEKNNLLVSIYLKKKSLNAEIIKKFYLDSLEAGDYLQILDNYLYKERSITPICFERGSYLEDLDTYGFNKNNNRFENDRFFIQSDVHVSCLSSDAMTVFDLNGHYYPTRSGRVAKASLVNLYHSSTCKVIEKAYILPFPHSAANYYHSLCEIGYGFRYIKRVNNKMPIVHGDDKFGIIDFFAQCLNIPKERFINVKDIKEYIIKKAYLPDIGPYYWSRSMVKFFRSCAINSLQVETSPIVFKKIYISRSLSNRSPIYEKKLEEGLTKKGFKVIHAEQLSLKDQICIFINADIVVAHHGAGLGNIIFCHDRVSIYEIFPKNFLSPDFYHRSEFVTDSYFPVFGINNNNYIKFLNYFDEE